MDGTSWSVGKYLSCMIFFVQQNKTWRTERSTCCPTESMSFGLSLFRVRLHKTNITLHHISYLTVCDKPRQLKKIIDKLFAKYKS